MVPDGAAVGVKYEGIFHSLSWVLVEYQLSIVIDPVLGQHIVKKPGFSQGG